MNFKKKILLVGEVFVDFTMPNLGKECKLRLGGVAHAARALWAIKAQYSAAIFCPSYLISSATDYLKSIGCHQVYIIGFITGSPNVIAFSDVKELADQGYEDLLRDNKKIEYDPSIKPSDVYDEALIFPGKYNLKYLRNWLPSETIINIDIAYDVDQIQTLKIFENRISTIFTSTSSALFKRRWSQSIDEFIKDMKSICAKVAILKENRGGSRYFDLESDHISLVGAILDETVNSVGVGDAFSAAFTFMSELKVEAVWRASYLAASYAQTTYPADFKENVSRNMKLTYEDILNLGGCSVPWHVRPKYKIYLAAPDFSYTNSEYIELAIKSLAYHNFSVIRPIKENGELEAGSPIHELVQTYNKDLNLLADSKLVFAVPQFKDPGTLVEIGVAIEKKIPVVTWDPCAECDNTMVIAGSKFYSEDFGQSLNALFDVISRMRSGNE